MAKLPKNIGWSIGTEMRESHYQITAKNAALVKPGMLFNVSIGALSRQLLSGHKPGIVFSASMAVLYLAVLPGDKPSMHIHCQHFRGRC